MEGETVVNRGDDIIDLPPGFRFHPTDEEIITHYLMKKVIHCGFTASAIGEADLNKCEPWDLPKRAKMGEKEWYFFCQKDRKYPTGMRTNRATESGYWKATGKDKEIFRGKNCLVGMKKTLVFYKGRAPKGEKTNWVIHEYRLEGKFAYYQLSKSSKDEWVVCRVFHKSTGIKKNPIFPGLLRIGSTGGLLSDSVPPLMDPNYCSGPSSSFAHASSQEDYDRENGVGDRFHVPSAVTVNANNYYDDNGFGAAFTPAQLQKNPTSLFSYMQGSSDQNPDYFVGYGSTDNYDRHAIIWGSAAATDGPAAEKLPKVEQFSSRVSFSQDTGATADANGEITSSAASGHQNKGIGGSHYTYEDLEGPSVDPISDILEYSWG